MAHMDEPMKHDSVYYLPDLEISTTRARTEYLLQRLAGISKYACETFPDIKVRFSRAGLKPDSFDSLKDLEKLSISRTALFGNEAVCCNGWTQALFAAGMRPGDVAQVNLGLSMSTLAMALDQSLRALNVRSIPSGTAGLDIQIDLMKDLEVDACICTPEAMTVMADYADMKGLDIQKDLKLKLVFLVSPHPVLLPLEQKDRWGVFVRSAFGTAELGCLGYECSSGSSLHWPDDVLIEIVDLESGRQLGPGWTGEVVVTTFDKKYPLIRFGTGRLGSYTDVPCSCGRTTNRWVKLPEKVRTGRHGLHI